jgi:hypothetical protein
MEKHQAQALCREHMHRYVLVQTHDGQQFDGIVENVDDDNLYLAVPNWGTQTSDSRLTPFGFGYPGYGYGYGYPYGYGYGFPGYGFGFGYPFYGRRFRRFGFPLASLAALSLLPFY